MQQTVKEGKEARKRVTFSAASQWAPETPNTDHSTLKACAFAFTLGNHIFTLVSLEILNEQELIYKSTKIKNPPKFLIHHVIKTDHGTL